ncbi:FAD-dependent oxidoreductase [Sphingomonas immobilis]|uniref:Thioredoxin reductase n=1 Tax=Sphingomonas immobilis TaxID=3063997 RepID=A0ABT8ZWH7_9SPHN|nr:FAD-dependent oxidoreductase [Sphingomonas sp. CA1-15]MDO7841131.1 FAD-dependent oxidoreductase [Sphingomonas sp. CA1-15]
MSNLDQRRDQMFPVLTGPQIDVARRFASGEAQAFEPGATIFGIGDVGAPAWLVLEGSIAVIRRDGLNHDAAVTEHHVGQFSGEVNQLSGRPSIAGGSAGADGCTALPFDAAHLRALMVGSADIGETVMRALILRRVGLIEEGGAGSIIIGAPNSPEVTRLQGFLARSGYPHLVLDAASDEEGKALIERSGVLPEELPLMVCPNGTILKRPTTAEVSICLGMMPQLDPDKVYDVAVVGAGPAGLAAAVYAASEGLSVLVLDERAIGGQAGASARIENYLGFPTGISGQALAGRAFSQALKFGAEIAIPLGVHGFDCPPDHVPGDPLVLELADGRVRARAVIIASGARYRRPDIADLDQFEGAGISYWASPIEAKLCENEKVALVGGGNSAGQAIVFLASRAKEVNVVVRRPLEETMSRYLIDRIAALPNVELHVGKEICGLKRDAAGGLCGATFRDRKTGEVKSCDSRHLFLFIGADPNTTWLQDCVDTDDKGFIVTGKSDLPLETSIPGVFAIGDVRAESTKRVAAAVGEGAAVVAQIHAMFARVKAEGGVEKEPVAA